MTRKLITLWGTEPRVGRRTLARLLATHLAEEKRSVVLVGIDPQEQLFGNEGVSYPDPAGWIPQFAVLSPNLFKNYLSLPNSLYAQLPLRSLPPAPLLKDLLRLLKTTFDWTLVVCPVDFSPESLSVLDASHLLLWMARPSALSVEHLRQHRDVLATHHFPHALSQWVLNRVPANVRRPEDIFHDLTGHPPLGVIPEELPRGAGFRRGVAVLAQTLLTREDIYLTAADPKAAPKSEPAQAIVNAIKTRIQPQLLEALEGHDIAGDNLPHVLPAEVAQKTIETCLAQDASLNAPREVRVQIYNRVMDEVLGLGPLEPLLKDSEISEVMVNGQETVFVEKGGKLYPSSVRFSSEIQLRTVIDRIVAPIGRRVDESMPLCDARLPDGSRVNIVVPPLALDGSVITIRKFRTKPLDIPELVSGQSLTLEMANFLKHCVRLRKNIVVSGGTGSGKTTLLNALSGMIPDDERIVTIEDAAELRLQKPHVIRLESRPANAEGEGAIPIRRLVINALRMRPDRIVVGECRGGEALDMLQAMNTGHDGSLTTLHANTPRDALSRLETLVLMAGMELPVKVIREQIRSAIQIIVQQARQPDGSRKIISITEVTGLEGETITIQELFRLRASKFESTGLPPTFAQEIKQPC